MAIDIIKSLATVVGSKHVITASAGSAAPYHKLFGNIAGREKGFAAAVLPGSVEEVQAIVRQVSDGGYGLWSMPNAMGNGAGISRNDRPGIIVDMQRMNKVLEVNATSAYALVEPGVSYQQLYEYITSKKIPLWMDCDREPRNSIAGSICSRQTGYTPYGDHLMMQSGMEVVLGDGGIMRTGMGALPNSDTWQLFKYNFGPYWDGMFTQSDLALVTKIGLWLMPTPPVFMPFMVTLSKPEDLHAAVELLRPLKINSVIPNTVAITDGVLDLTPYRRRDEIMKDGLVDRAALANQGFGAWNIYGALYGIQDNVDLTWQAVDSAFKSINDAGIYLQQDRKADPVWKERMELMRGIPPGHPHSFSGWGEGYMNMIAAAPMDGDAAMRLHDMVRTVVSDHGIDYLCEYLLPGRTLLKNIYLPYSDNASSRDSSLKAAGELMDKLTRAGYGIVYESLELRHVADNFYHGTPLDGLIDRIRNGIHS